ncbi:MAG: 4Fe-4S binding protein [Tannerellaceae bacterium]|jgi:NADH:ubiquinone oxidoreductase subunit F (NADH-binding)/NAD-dependent dihydropyrimidine dehydrogenase PreA subunit|nr:4Fe-4S binding protein [Tannerellaceae bacterium]
MDANTTTQVRISMATCGIAAGAKEVMDAFTAAFARERITASVIPTGCMGYCYAEPTVAVTLPGKEPLVFGHVNRKKAERIISSYIRQGIIPEDILRIERDPAHKQLPIALRNCGYINPESIDEYILSDGYRALEKVLAGMTPEEAIQVVVDSGLRGRGGGGFPTGLKWRYTRKTPSPQKYVVCNADEGDPGAFMDRSILEGDPHSVIEAMIINGYCTGADKGLVYIRAEYPLAIERLNTAIRQARAYGFLGEHILATDFSFDIEIRYGAGAFVCGEETALIHSMEGRRGEATVKPPFPSEQGYKGFPTNVNNVETYANIPVIFLRGAGWFNRIGTEKSKGTKVFALAGKVNRVGLIEVPMGTTLREVIFDIGGGIKDNKRFKAVQTGGPSGGCLTEKHLDLPIDYDNLVAAGSMMGSGGMIVMDEDDCMVAMAQFYLDFSVEESCGKCSPCRIGNKRLHELLRKITSGRGERDDLERLRNLALVIKDTALCGLGQTSPNPVLSTMDNFAGEYLAHVLEQRCPSHQCRSLTQYFIDPDKCTGCTLCARACSVDAIRGERKTPHVIDPTLCIRCGSCLDKCTFHAVYVH